MKTKDLVKELQDHGSDVTEENIRQLAREFDTFPPYFRQRILEYLATPTEKREEEQLFYVMLPDYFEKDNRCLNYDTDNKKYFFSDEDGYGQWRTKFTHEEIILNMPKGIVGAIQNGFLKMEKAN